KPSESDSAPEPIDWAREVAFAICELQLSEEQFWSMHCTTWSACLLHWKIKHGQAEDPARERAQNRAAQQGLLAFIRHAKADKKGRGGSPSRPSPASQSPASPP